MPPAAGGKLLLHAQYFAQLAALFLLCLQGETGCLAATMTASTCGYTESFIHTCLRMQQQPKMEISLK